MMKRFLINVFILGLISITIFFTILQYVNGYTDAFYIRFTTPKQDNLIVGTSRAAQGLQPQIFKKLLDLDIYNYSFTLGQSPYGPVYFESIKKKLNKNIINGIFIVTIDPWSISSISKNPNDIKFFRENGKCLDNTTSVDSKPNYQYIFNNLSGKYATILTNYKRNTFLHENGWLEISVNMDSSETNKRIKRKVQDYRKNLTNYKFSNVRLYYLEKIIKHLKGHGKVYLVRLPIHDKIMEIEDEFMPDFDEKIKTAISLSNGYYNMTPLNMKFEYTDGNHLFKESGNLVSEEIVNWIKIQ